MARVKITVEREGGSTIEIAEQSAMPLFTDEQCAMLAQEAYVRTLRALGVQERPDPEPPAADVRPSGEKVLTPAQQQEVADRIAERKAA